MTTAQILEKQRQYFLTNETKNIKFRKHQLVLLKQAIISNEQKIYALLARSLTLVYH